MPERSFELLSSQSQKKPLLSHVLTVIALFFAIAASGAAYYFYTKTLPAKSDQAAEEVVKEVSKVMLLPDGELPTVATVSEPDKLKDQPFFAHARSGYKVLIYTKARKAILYDPESRRIIEVAPLTPGSTTPGTPVGTTP